MARIALSSLSSSPDRLAALNFSCRSSAVIASGQHANGVIESLVLILTGLFKKVVIADGEAAVVAGGFLFASEASVLTLLFTAWGFARQIYGDFFWLHRHRARFRLAARYGATGQLPPAMPRENITEFWRRWHVSLSNWLRDYLYIPLGGNRGSNLATYRNLILTMLLGGLWHGASWTFVVWGGLPGLLLALDRLRGRDRDDVERPTFGGATCCQSSCRPTSPPCSL